MKDKLCMKFRRHGSLANQTVAWLEFMAFLIYNEDKCHLWTDQRDGNDNGCRRIYTGSWFINKGK